VAARHTLAAWIARRLVVVRKLVQGLRLVRPSAPRRARRTTSEAPGRTRLGSVTSRPRAAALCVHDARPRRCHDGGAVLALSALEGDNLTSTVCLRASATNTLSRRSSADWWPQRVACVADPKGPSKSSGMLRQPTPQYHCSMHISSGGRLGPSKREYERRLYRLTHTCGNSYTSSALLLHHQSEYRFLPEPARRLK
jgi:hypothetical protein